MLHAAPPLRPPAVVRRHVPPVGPHIARVALSLVGASTRRFLPHSPRKACAAFTSSALVKAGALQPKFRSASATQLTRNLLHAGWRRIGPPVSVRSHAAHLARPGDVLAFGPCGRGRIAHVGISQGAGRFVGTSSSRGRVKLWTLADWVSQRCVRIYRHR